MVKLRSLGGYETEILESSGIVPKKTSKEDSVSNLRKLLEWSSQEIEKGKDVDFLATSGIANPDVWNALEKNVLDALGKGMKYTHVVGPLLCVGENGGHTVITAKKEYPRQVEIQFSRTRELYHFTLASSVIGDSKTGLTLFNSLGECYHDLGSEERETFLIDGYMYPEMSIWIPKTGKTFFLMPGCSNSILYFNGKQYSHKVNEPFRDKYPIHRIPTATKGQLSYANEQIHRKHPTSPGRINVVNAEQLMEYAKIKLP